MSSRLWTSKWIRLAVLALVLGGLTFAATGHRAAADQPHMQAALDALRVAEKQLLDADNDKGGHKRAALMHVRQAIEQVERGIKFDRRR